MEYKNLVKDFSIRTRSNLHLLRELQAANKNLEIYEVTQLINSMLGLLILPQQKYVDEIPKIPLADLQAHGWPIPRIIGD